ncbi:MAG: putative aminotransferase [Firmicutes bacterium ADurb.Bin182]|nr:MAG: putative aminotransferase [Firmicutes bacterium ADurb.Bin182]
MKWTELSKNDLLKLRGDAQKDYADCVSKRLHLDMSRGKPGREQLDLSNEMLSVLNDPAQLIIDGVETRNYGELGGIRQCRALFADILGVKTEEVFAAGNSSLSLMYDTIAKAYTHGLLHSEKPWSKLNKVKFLCPSPGYDRHFAISESFGMELIAVGMNEQGPDMDAVEELIKDEAVKGMWCVPKYSNPEGIIYGDETVRRIACLKPAAKDFIVMWDNAYCVHEFEGDFVPFKDILTECRNAGNPDMVFEFASTSKLTFPGAGVACFACSEANMAYMKKLIGVQAISYDKINQLRHVLFLKNKQGVLEHAKKHAKLLKPKFDAVLSALDEHIAPLGIAAYHRPKGGYFISLNTLPGCAKRTYKLMKDAGVVMTEAGATFPYGIDPKDQNLRIAPTLPPLSELYSAMEALCICIKLAALEKLLKF